MNVRFFPKEKRKRHIIPNYIASNVHKWKWYVFALRPIIERELITSTEKKKNETSHMEETITKHRWRRFVWHFCDVSRHNSIIQFFNTKFKMTIWNWNRSIYSHWFQISISETRTNHHTLIIAHQSPIDTEFPSYVQITMLLMTSILCIATIIIYPLNGSFCHTHTHTNSKLFT